MKKLFVMLVLAASAFGTTVQAQEPAKIGYTSINYILSQLPDSKRIEQELKTHQTQLETSLQAKLKDFREKADIYEKSASTWADPIRQDKEKELQTLQNSIQEFQQNAQADLQKKEAALLQPLIRKIYETAADVGKENGYVWVINSDEANPVLILAPKENDISDLVIKKIGSTPIATPTKPAAQNPTTASTPKTTVAPAKKK